MAGLALPSAMPASAWAAPRRKPDSLPFPKAPEGEDMIPQIDHIVVAMMENHSYDNYLGVLGRGDGFRLDRRRPPEERLPGRQRQPDPRVPHAVDVPARPRAQPGLEREPHLARRAPAQRRLRARQRSGRHGLLRPRRTSPSTTGSRGTFPVCDRFFASCLAQTYPNRKFLMCGTAVGQISTDIAEVGKAPPPNGTIFERLNAHGISWRNYYTDLPQVAALPAACTTATSTRWSPIDQFHLDAAAGTLPAVSFVDPGFDSDESEENNADIRMGETFVARVVNAVMAGPDGRRRSSSGCTTRAAATTTTCRRRAPSRRTTSRPRSPCRPTFRAATIATASASRQSSSRRTRAAIRLAPRARPHLGPEADRDQVEPAGADLSRRERERPARRAQLPQAARLPRSADAAQPRPVTPRGASRANPGPIPPPDAVIPAR